MPKEEELEAMIRLCMRIDQYINTGETDKEKIKEDIDIVWEYTRKIIQQRKIAREKANAWNKSNPDKHRKHCRDYAKRKRERRMKCKR